MTALEIYKAQYEKERSWFTYRNKYVWLAHRVFELTTYDSGLDELFVKDILEVCKVILEHTNFEYIKDETNYVKYILVCQLFHNFSWIEWGTSIRGAWFEKDHSRNILEELEWWDNEHHVIDSVPFSVENLQALIEFVEE